jgi:chorismate lyase
MLKVSLKNQPPENILPWLTYVELLTEKLYNQAGNTSMSVLNQSQTTATWWDRYVLKLDFEAVFHREIVTSAWEKPCWYARTIIPMTTYKSHKLLFDKLRFESLGKLIFGNNKIKRESLEYYSINKQDIEFQWLTRDLYKESEILWVRRSVFYLPTNAKFYLVEILLPDLEKYTCQN